MRHSPRYAAVIPYRVHAGRVEIALITSARRRKWIVPKGRVRAEEGPSQAAVREALEEAGLIGVAAPTSLGRCSSGSRQSPTVDVYLLEVLEALDHWAEDHFRERRWMSLPDALSAVRQEFRPFIAAVGDLLAATANV